MSFTQALSSSPIPSVVSLRATTERQTGNQIIKVSSCHLITSVPISINRSLLVCIFRTDFPACGPALLFAGCLLRHLAVEFNTLYWLLRYFKVKYLIYLHPQFETITNPCFTSMIFSDFNYSTTFSIYIATILSLFRP